MFIQPTILVRSQLAASHIAEDIEESFLWISIKTPNSETHLGTFNPTLIRHLKLEFFDADEANWEYDIVFNEALADKVWSFLFEYQNYPIEYLLINCEAGVSRSQGMGAAITRCLLEEDDSHFFKNFSPNRLVYTKMIEAWEFKWKNLFKVN